MTDLDRRIRAIVARYVPQFRRVADAAIRRQVPLAVREALRKARPRP